MRKIFPIFTISMVLTVAFITSISYDSDGKVTIDPYEVPPETMIPLTLSDFDFKGDVLKLTIVFKEIFTEDYIPRGINILIVDKTLADRSPKYETAEAQAIFVRTNVSTLMSVDVENTRNGKKSIMFFNPLQDGDIDPDDSGAWENGTVRIRIDYTVINVAEDEGMNILPIVMVFAIIITIAIMIMATIMFFKRRSKDVKTFFDSTDGPYYTFRSIVEDKVYYLDPDQYARLYNSNSMDEYDFLGTATRIGGPITPPDGIGMEAMTSMPMDGQLMMAVPLEGGQPPVDIASMEAMPIAPTPVEGIPEQGIVEEPPQEDPTYEELYGQYQQEVPDPSSPSPDTPEQDNKEAVVEEQKEPAPEDPSGISAQPPPDEGSEKVVEDEPLSGTETPADEAAKQE